MTIHDDEPRYSGLIDWHFIVSVLILIAVIVAVILVGIYVLKDVILHNPELTNATELINSRLA